jgi:hypothetical protein
MTSVVSFYGGPGSGKSTLAAATFAELKRDGVNCELVFEYVKSWAWESRSPSKYDELYIFGQQVRRETLLYGKVDVVLTDRPLRLSGFYARHFGQDGLAYAMDVACDELQKAARLDGHQFVDVFVTPSSEYDPAGRYQTADEAADLGRRMRAILPVFNFVTTKQSSIAEGLKALL